MTDRKRVFCKDCKWFVETYFETNPKLIHEQYCRPVPFRNPITGNPHTENSYRHCEVANAHCDCPDFQLKENDNGDV